MKAGLLRVVLIEPEIPPNTGNIARTCAATGTPLHLVGRLGFELSDRYLKRAGLDYWPHVELYHHPDRAAFLAEHTGERLVLTSARRGQCLWDFRFQAGDWLVFGCETRGLDPSWFVEDRYPAVTIPMAETGVRSLNLSNAVAIVLYEGLRQLREL